MSCSSLIPCRQMVELVTDYLEGMLPDGDRVRFEEHIALCGHCTAYLEQMRLTLKVVGHIDPEQLDPAVERDLLDAFRGWRDGEQA